ncbi:DNRLRE domain-containing protein, partial [Dermabacter hominis]|uniref:DNRLRE domain-containing protein n=1 Tax=Dermabacter hominis TaxID=36740 RepID=UPI00242FA0CB
MDFPSAAIRARATGQRVEVTAERSESSTTWVNPDGSVTTEQFAAPVRFKNDKGEWASFNTDLVEKADGSLAPASVPEGVVLAGEVNGTDAQPAEVASLSGGAADSQIAVTWPDTLGAPRVEGSTATYAKAWPGIDLRVTATRDGFEQSFIIADRTAAEAYAADQSGSAVTWDVPLSIPDGVTAREIQGERVEFVDSAGNVVSRFEAPMAWDAFVDAKSQEHTQHAGVGVQLVDQTSDGVTLRLSVDRAWLLDSARVFPVTVDPVYASASARPTFDAFVQSNISSDRSSEQELKVGTYDGRAKARSFLTFSTASFKGVKVQSASLKVWESWSYSCTPKPLEVWSTKSVASAAMRWSSQPALASRVGSVNVAKGHSSSCAAGWVSIPITSVVQSWSTSSAGSASLALKAASETDVNGWKRFASMESTTPPSIVFTYDRKPNVAAVPTVAGTATYGADTYVASKRPVVSTTATDPDGNSMRANIEVHTSTAGTTDSFVTKCATGLGASGSTLSCTLPADLPDNKTLYVRAKVVDELSVWSASWSGWKTIKTAQLKPAAPTITCQGYTNGSWVQSPPSANVPCTITVPSLGGNNQAVQLDYRVDGNTAATAVAVTAGKSATMSLPKSAGGHQIRARVYSASRMQSDAAVFTIGWGGPALYSPSRLEASNGAFNVLAKAPPRTANETTVSARMQWRMSGSDDPWTNAGAATPVTAALGKETVYSGTFDAAAALAAANKTSRGPVRMDFQVCFTYSGVKSPMCTGTVAPTVVVRVPHAFGDGYPTTDVETGQVALYTGEFQTSDTDVTVPGYGSDITLSRSHLSFTGSGDVKAWPVDPVTGVFGPGFTANLEGDDSAGLAGVEVIDQRMSDGSIALMGEDGDALVFVNPSGKRETVTGTLVPGTTDTELSGVTAKITGTAAAPTLVVTESDGTVTTFQPASGGAGK